MQDESSSIQPLSSGAVRRLSRRGRGCLIVAAVVLTPYLLNALFFLGRNYFYEARWRTHGSSDYTITVQLSALSPIQGESVISVQNSRIISSTNPLCPSCERGIYQSYTVEAMFGSAIGCALLFPFLICAIEYDSKYGYPRAITINCPIPDACYSSVTVTSLEFTP